MYGLHCEPIDSFETANDNLSEIYTRYAAKENETTEPIVIYGTKAELMTVVTCKIVA